MGLLSYLKLKNYQLEVTIGTSMMEPSEKVVFNVGCIFLILLWLYSTVTFFPAWVQTTLDLVETHAPWVIESLPFLGQASQSS